MYCVLYRNSSLTIFLNHFHVISIICSSWWATFLIRVITILTFVLFPQTWLWKLFHESMMAESSNRRKASSRGLLSNYRYLCKKAMVLCAMENARARKRHQEKRIIANMKMKRTDAHHESLDTNVLIRRSKMSAPEQEDQSTLNSESTDLSKHTSVSGTANHHSVIGALGDRWEMDSGFSSEASPPASGRSSPCFSSCPTTVVALDCEMVGTGSGGRCSELARCSILDYHGNVLYDKYVKPCQPVTDFRTRWSGIRRHHLLNATPFIQAREEVRLSVCRQQWWKI